MVIAYATHAETNLFPKFREFSNTNRVGASILINNIHTFIW